MPLFGGPFGTGRRRRDSSITPRTPSTHRTEAAITLSIVVSITTGSRISTCGSIRIRRLQRRTTGRQTWQPGRPRSHLHHIIARVSIKPFGTDSTTYSPTGFLSTNPNLQHDRFVLCFLYEYVRCEMPLGGGPSSYTCTISFYFHVFSLMFGPKIVMTHLITNKFGCYMVSTQATHLLGGRSSPPHTLRISIL